MLGLAERKLYPSWSRGINFVRFGLCETVAPSILIVSIKSENEHQVEKKKGWRNCSLTFHGNY